MVSAEILPAALLLVFAAFLIKGITGFGAGLILVPVLASWIGARETVLLAGLLDLASNAFIALRERIGRGEPGWRLAASTGVASALGGFAMVRAAPDALRSALAIFLLGAGLWYIFRRSARTAAPADGLPGRFRTRDQAVAAVSGLLGGLFGLAGPVIAAHLGSFLGRDAFRRTLVQVLLVSASARVAVHLTAGAYSGALLLLSAAAIPAIVAGILVGQRMVLHVQEAWFGRLVGMLLLVSAAILA